jgi:phospholipid/cholesterol/gamma-HCH transport system substrate-binding protein
MEATRTTELGTGLFIFLGFAALFFLATQTTDLEGYLDEDSYTVIARFDDVSGLKTRAPVTMSGVNIGRVERIAFDAVRLDALVTLQIKSEFDSIPDDSDASILTSGLLGNKYIGIGAGGSETYLSDQSEIDLTQSSVVLENLISKLMFKLGAEQ